MSRKAKTSSRFDEKLKREMLRAVFKSLSVKTDTTAETVERYRDISNDNTRMMLMNRSFSRNTKAFLALIVGRSQQRYLKRHSRQFDAWRHSREIAEKIGANPKDVERQFQILMNQFIYPTQ